MTAPLPTPALPENCPRCGQHLYHATVAHYNAQADAGTLPPAHFSLDCPRCRAILVVNVIARHPPLFRFELPAAPGGRS